MAFDSFVVGPSAASSADGSNVSRAGRQQDLIVSELHGRFYEQVFRGNTYSTGMQLTSISNATFTTATGLSGTLGTAATATPIVGMWNPTTATNAVILQATLATTLTALQNTGTGGFVWAVFTGNTAGGITVANQATPVNRKTLLASGSSMKGLSGLALTGLASAGTFLSASTLEGGSSYNIALLGTAAGFVTTLSADTENFDGSLIVPPGGILALFCATTPVAHSVTSSLMWEEVPVN
jgi:hypothetical protein